MKIISLPKSAIRKKWPGCILLLTSFYILLPTFIFAQMDWIQATASAGWSGRSGHTSVVFNNKIWVLGGSSDVWYSSDGVNWTEATPNGGWSTSGHTSVVFDNKMWVLGGWPYTDDVWYSYDGVNWTCATNQPGWSARQVHTSVVFDNKIWVLGGYNGSSYLRDVWYSTDGEYWTQATATAGWQVRGAHTSVVFDNKMWVLGGFGGGSIRRNDVWYSRGLRNSDVGIIQILFPSGTIDSGSVVIPQAKVKNFGTVPASFPVIFKIGTFYTNTQNVSNLNPDDSIVLNFASWTVLQRGTHMTKCTTALTDDQNPSNDAINGSVTVRVRDVGVVQILAPIGIVDSGISITPSAIVRNYGSATETFPVTFKIGTFYTQTRNKTLLAGVSDTVNFLSWTGVQIGTHITKCTTLLSGDIRSANNFVTDSVRVRRVVGIDEPLISQTLLKISSVENNSPNPFISQTSIRYAILKEEKVNLSIYNSSGILIRILKDGTEKTGLFEAFWNGYDEQGKRVPKGVYFYRLEAGKFSATKKMVKLE